METKNGEQQQQKNGQSKPKWIRLEQQHKTITNMNERKSKQMNGIEELKRS